VRGCGIEHEFRCTVVPGLVKYRDLESIAAMLEGAEALVLQQFRPEKTLEPGFQELKPYSDDVLLRWADRLSSRVNIRTRGLRSMVNG
jgi:hypothetical protein